MHNKKTEIITFFSVENFFKLKSEATQKARFESLKGEYEKEFSEPLEDHIFTMLLDYQKEQQAAKKARELKKAQEKAALPIAKGCNTATEHIKHLPRGKYLLTSAQNNTHINEIMLNCMLTFCRENDAKLLIGRLTYNKSGFNQPDINAENDGLWYDEKIKPFLVNGHIDLQGAHFLSDSNVIPTAKNPLSGGFEGATPPGVHCVIPATKISLQVVASLKNSPTKTLVSTGAVTLRNYIMRKAGAIANLSHNIGAVFVDTTNPENVIIRTIELMPECEYFFDFDKKYGEKFAENVKNGEISALQPGDIHAEKMTKENLNNILGLIDKLRPVGLILHDLLDFSTRNHHNIKDCTFSHLQRVLQNTVEKDLQIMAGFIDDLLDKTECDIYVVESNHDLALLTWLKNNDVLRTDPENALVYLKCMLALYEYQKSTGLNDFNMLEHAYIHIAESNGCSDRLKFNRVDDSLIIASVEMGCHGHNGANGSKGSPQQFKKLGIKMNTGHTHSPSIYGGVYTAGVASLEMGYNIGASSWAIAHIVTFCNGQRQIIFK